MKPSTVEWIEKAEVDWEVAQRSYRARKVVLHDAACFHCQQCIEKYLKAKLNEAGITFTKTHNLEDLLKLLLPIEPGWLILQPQMAALNPYAVLFRYPDMTLQRLMPKLRSRIAANCDVLFASHLACLLKHAPDERIFGLTVQGGCCEPV